MATRRVRRSARVIRLIRVGLVGATVLALAGCFEPPEGESLLSPRRTTNAAQPAALVKAWARSSTPFSNVVNIGGAAVLYVKQGRYLRISALDPATGKVLWSDQASPSFLTRGTPLLPFAIGDKVAYYRAADSATDLRASLVIAEPRTGQRLANTPREYFHSNIYRCAHDPAVACVMAWGAKADRWLNYQFSLAEPELVAQKYPAQTFGVGRGGLSAVGYESPQKLGVFVDGTAVWQRPLAQLLGKGFTTESGWDFTYWDKQGVFTGSAGSDAWGTTIDLARSVTAGFSAADGTMLWQERSTYANCLGGAYLIVPGLEDTTQALRCRYTGAVTRTDRGARPAGPRLSVRLERYDVMTGRSVWSTPIGKAPVMTLVRDGSTPIVDDRHLFVDTGARTLVIDLETGRAERATPATQLWCRPDSEMQYHLPVWVGDDPDHHLSSWGLAYPCAVNGKAIANPRLSGVPAFVGAAFDGGISVYASPKAVVAYRTP